MSLSASPSAVHCPTCDGVVLVPSGVVLSELLTCRDCGTDLEVTATDPVQVREAPMEEEDWGQ